ncbi:MAG: Coenzyme F420 hydrogenase/dehydrogenase, beta subunit C-terminal domain [Clostridia bacterium]|nr:Coenzyme F420 hydrogenase/dehydrogenase, beta subunit C-terminal domain [Clostridia bacterium]
MNRQVIDLVPDAADCSGCGACMLVCPKGAITMQAALDGSLFPVIDQKQCIGCGRCLRQCVYRQPADLNAPKEACAAVARDSEVVSHSASGGMFAALAKHWIQCGGLVAGAVMDCSHSVQVYHILSDRVEDVQRMQGSKYVQSDAWRCYQAVLDALAAGKQVLFSGTPCQVAAIRELTGDPDHLTTIDLICHGVPPLKLLDDYVRLLSRRFHGQIEAFRFRDKALKKSFSASLDVRYGEKVKRFHLRSHELSFYKYFLEGANYRENCYSCPFARLERTADLTIGDYWGVRKRHAADFEAKKMPDVADWSCVLVNTPKGRRLLDLHAQEISLYASAPEWVAEENHQLSQPTIPPEGRMSLKRLYEQKGYGGVEKAFIQEKGGSLKYHLRLCKQLYRNQRAVQQDQTK